MTLVRWCCPKSRVSFALAAISWSVIALLASSKSAPSLENEIIFGRDIRPLLSDRCFRCHGPDPSTREADLRLDSFEFATSNRDGGAAIVPGDPEGSEVYRRITADDPDDVMPPVGSHRKALNSEEAEAIRAWIESGARYEQHWAFVAPAQAELPNDELNPVDAFVRQRLANSDLEPSAITSPELALRRLFLDVTGLPATPEETDAFLGALEIEERAVVWRRWIRKLFAEEPYRSRYAERMTSPWLDQARYADTSGIHTDAGRQIWPWRDWVLEAYRHNMPFDRFLTEQLAGDLLPNATVAQRIASGFNRNHITTDEGGAIPEEYLVEYAADRAETTATVALGLTMGCARCHDHKFDPLTQKDYYSLFAFFASNEEPGLYSQLPDPKRAFEPFMEVPSEEQVARREQLAADLTTARSSLDHVSPEDVEAMARYRAELPGNMGLEWVEAEVAEMHSSNGTTLQLTERGTILSTGENPDTDVHTFRLRTSATGVRLIQLDVLGHESFTNGAPGRAGNGNAVLTGIRFEAISVADPQQRRELKASWFWADKAQDNEDWSLFRSFDERPNTGWAIAGHTDGQERVALFVMEQPFGFEGGTDVQVTLEYNSVYAQHAFGHVRLSLARLKESALDALPVSQSYWYHAGPFELDDPGTAYAQSFEPEQSAELDLATAFEASGGASIKWVFRQDFRDDALNRLNAGVNLHYVAREIYAASPREIEVSLGSDDGFALFVNGTQVAAREIPRGVQRDQDRARIPLEKGRNSFVFKVINTGGEAGFFYRVVESLERLDGDLVAGLVETSVRKDQGQALDDRFRHSWRLSRSPEYRAGQESIASLLEQQTQLESDIPKTMVMKELDEKRPTYVLERGQYDKADESRPVTPDVPAIFGGLQLEQEPTRLDLAEWMTSKDNPLVSRVAVNRIWQMLFGTGLVSTSGDFGAQGSWPSHPELLDWLAVEFVESGWNLQALLELILTSETYQQSSRVAREALELDPENRLLSHYPRRRLDAERVRDHALFVSGLLKEELGGPSVKPYHPSGLWREVSMIASNTRIYERGGEADLWRRSLYTYWKRACPPPSLMTFDAPTREACVVQRASTNTPLQALVLWNDEQYLEAARVLAQRTLAENEGDEMRIDSLMRRCAGRRPSERESQLLSDALVELRQRYATDEEAARQLIAIGESPINTELEPSELAAWTLLANAVLNLHATITQG